MYQLHKVKDWFSRQFKFLESEEPAELAGDPEDNGPDIRFYTQNYKITTESKRKMVELVKRPEFRDFENYLDWRVNACAHRMKAFLVQGKPAEAASEASAIDALVKITQDMENFWKEVALTDTAEGLVLKEKQSAITKAFGDEKYDINLESNETERI